MLRLVLCSSLIFAASATAVRAQTQWNGPLPVQNERPYQSAFLHFESQSPDILSQGQARYGVAFHVANDLLIPSTSNESRVEEDFETGRIQLNYSRGIGKGWEVGARTNVIVRDNGAFDGPIEFYQRLLGISDDGKDHPEGRTNIPRNRDVLFFQDANGNGVSEASASGLGDTTLELRRQLSTGKDASAARFAVKIPTGNGSKILGSGSFDAGFGLDARHEFGSRLSLFGSINAFVYGHSKIPDAQNSGIGGALGLEYRAGKRDSIVAQVDAQSRTITTGNSFADRTPVISSIGYKHRFGDNRTLFASLSGNGELTNYNAPFLGNIGPDLTASIGMEWRH